MKTVCLITVGLLVPFTVLASQSPMLYAKVDKIETGHLFSYQCRDNGNLVQVEQRYNPNAQAEEIRFIVNGETDEWVTKGISRDIFVHLAENACSESTTAYSIANN